MNTQKHLTFDTRTTIELELGKASSFKAIGQLLNKDCTTISKEVRRNRIFEKKGTFGKYTQEQIDLMMSHINSYARKSLGNKCPYDVFAFQYGEELLEVFNLKKLPANEIILTPKLLKLN